MPRFGYAMETGRAKWAERAGVVLAIVGFALYLAAKVHFLTRYASLSAADYLAEHWPFWAGMAVVGVLMLVLHWVFPDS